MMYTLFHIFASLGRFLFLFQVELADIIAGYKALYKKDLSSDAETKFSENMKKLILPRLKKGFLFLCLFLYLFFYS